MSEPARPVIAHHDSPGERRIALLDAGALTEFHIDRPGAPDGLGDIHMARVTARVPSMAGAFVALAAAEAFLPDTAGGDGLTEGAYVIVRTTRAALGGKGPRVSARLDRPLRAAVAAEGPVRLLQRGPSALDELLAAYPGAMCETGPFGDALEAEIEALGTPHATLEGGLRAIFSPIAAMTGIDLDGAAMTGARGPKAPTQMAANRAAIPGLVRQIVLRNLSGAILVDFAGMPTRARPALRPVLTACLAADRLGSRLAGFSNLGFAEISRPRLRPPLHELLGSPHGIGMAALRQAAREVAASPARRLALRAGLAVIEALRADTEALAALARMATYPLVLRVDPALRHGWHIEDSSD